MKKSSVIIALFAVLFLASCSARTQSVKVGTEEDLRKDIQIEEVDRIFYAEPYFRHTRVDERGILEVRKYLSPSTQRNYTLSFWNRKLKRITWEDIKGDFQEVSFALRAPVFHGQLMEEVQGLAGLPDYKSEAGHKTMWWYSLTGDKAYLLYFEDSRLGAVALAPAREVKEYLEIYKRFVFTGPEFSTKADY